MKATTDIPNDHALPALAALLAVGLAASLPSIDLEERRVGIRLRGYTPGSRATFEVRAGQRHFALKAYAEDPAPEAALYGALAAAGLTGESEVHVPPLMAWVRDLRLLVIGWLEGPTAQELVQSAQGRRAGELAAAWLQCAASLPVKLGPALGAKGMLYRVQKWVATLGAADPALGIAATAVAGMLAVTQPTEGLTHLVHGTLYPRHILDLANGPGLIDWQRFGQGPLELDAGLFLATNWRIGLLREPFAREAARAEEAFLARTEGLLDQHTLAWYRAATLLRLANKLSRQQGDWRARAKAVLGEAARCVGTAG